MEEQKWEMGAPVGRYCCSIYCPSAMEPATWTLLNPADGGDAMYYCDICKQRMEDLRA